MVGRQLDNDKGSHDLSRSWSMYSLESLCVAWNLNRQAWKAVFTIAFLVVFRQCRCGVLDARHVQGKQGFAISFATATTMRLAALIRCVSDSPVEPSHDTTPPHPHPCYPLQASPAEDVGWQASALGVRGTQPQGRPR